MLMAERVGLLEHHADVAAHHHRVDRLGVDVLAVELHVALEAEHRDQVVHPVEAAQHRALAAARGADEAGDLALLDRHVAVAHGEEVAVEDLVDVAVDDDVAAAARSLPFARRWLRGDRTTCALVIERAPSTLGRPISRLRMLNTSTISTSTSEAAQASSIWFSNGMPEKL